jgi:hypothetical protein
LSIGKPPFFGSIAWLKWYMNCIIKNLSVINCASGPLREECSSMEIGITEKEAPKDSKERDVREDKLEDRIIDLVDSADEYLKTIETDFNLSGIDGDDLDDQLDKELMGIDAGDIKGTSASEDRAHPAFEKALLELFESSESAAAKLLEEEFQRDEGNAKSLEAGYHLQGGGVTGDQSGEQAIDEKEEIGGTPDPKEELPKNLFLNLEVVEQTSGREGGTNQTVPVDRERRVTSDKTNWLESGRYYPEYLQTIDTRIGEYEKEIEKLADRKKEIKKTYEHLRSILYLEGEQLKKAVAIILARYWSLKLAFMNKTKRAGFNENILIKYKKRIIIAKIKGTHSVSPSHKFITQVWQDLHYSGLGARADGALIVNHDIETDPETRLVPYDDENAEQLNDLIFIDTRVLHKLTTAIIDGDLSVTEATKILFKKGRVEFNGVVS